MRLWRWTWILLLAAAPGLAFDRAGSGIAGDRTLGGSVSANPVASNRPAPAAPSAPAPATPTATDAAALCEMIRINGLEAPASLDCSGSLAPPCPCADYALFSDALAAAQAANASCQLASGSLDTDSNGVLDLVATVARGSGQILVSRPQVLVVEREGLDPQWFFLAPTSRCGGPLPSTSFGPDLTNEQVAACLALIGEALGSCGTPPPSFSFPDTVPPPLE